MDPMEPNYTMRAELEDRLQYLKKCGAPFVKQKIVDLEKMLEIADLQKKLKRQRFVSSHLPSSKHIQECVQNTEAQLAAAVDLHLRRLWYPPPATTPPWKLPHSPPRLRMCRR